MRAARRLDRIPPYLFAELDKKRQAALARGLDVINLGIGDPDIPTPDHVIRRMQRAVENPAYHQYPAYEGSRDFRAAVADWYRERFSVQLDPDREVMTLIGSKEGIAHIFWAYVDEGDYVLLPDPGYPVYRTHTLLCGGRVYPLPLVKERGFLPDLASVPRDVAERAKILFLNYPNNPTAAVADLDFFRRAVDFCREHDILLCHDAAYSEITFDGYVAPSVLQVEGAKEVAIEFNSLSKPFNMTGWRLGFAVGSADAVHNLGVIKTNTDSGQFTAVQEAGVEALRNSPGDFIAQMCEVYRRRRDLVVEALNRIGWNLDKPLGSFYLWAPVPAGYTSASFAAELLEHTGVMVSPGSLYGESGEGYFRISLTVSDERLAEAMNRIEAHLAS